MLLNKIPIVTTDIIILDAKPIYRRKPLFLYFSRKILALKTEKIARPVYPISVRMFAIGHFILLKKTAIIIKDKKTRLQL